jgi:hypothetical protein
LAGKNICVNWTWGKGTSGLCVSVGVGVGVGVFLFSDPFSPRDGHCFPVSVVHVICHKEVNHRVKTQAC